MPYEEVSEPIPGREAFRQFGSAAVQSQAAFLLLLGIQAESDSEAALEEQLSAIIPEEDREQFSFPPLLRSPRERFVAEDIRASLTRRSPNFTAVSLKNVPGEIANAIVLYLIPDLIDDLYKEPAWRAAAELMETCLFHQDPLIRVAAAVSYFEISQEQDRLISILEQGTYEQDSLVRDVAATALARIVPDHPRLVELTASVLVGKPGEPSHTSLLAHGTWARSSAWWQPGGNFHTYLLNNVRNDLYNNGQDIFSWSGGHDHAARQLGAQDLVTWVQTHNLSGLDHLFTHSHGGSVAMLASQTGLIIDKLILLSCPVYGQYMPDFNRVGNVISIRVRLDLVILAGRGGQKYHHPQIQEHVLPVWFNHSATHDPNVWQKHHIPALL